MPWTADWLRARMIEEDRRLAYQALAHDHERARLTDAESLPAGVDT
jgi:hypothetical protein